MKIAVIKTGGKQYKVKANDRLKIEKIKGDEGQTVEFDQVLLVADGQKVEIGQPFLAGKKITARILKQSRSKKVTVLKYKPKTRYRRKKGHRQAFTQIEIEAI
ncbi:MAG TPA: 50S ribosomal protein L21 [Patescibacteria group bacterium]